MYEHCIILRAVSYTFRLVDWLLSSLHTTIIVALCTTVSFRTRFAPDCTCHADAVLVLPMLATCRWLSNYDSLGYIIMNKCNYVFELPATMVPWIVNYYWSKSKLSKQIIYDSVNLPVLCILKNCLHLFVEI